MKRTYLSGCKWCGATGIVPTTGMSTNTTEICPVYQGSKTVLVTEED